MNYSFFPAFLVSDCQMPILCSSKIIFFLFLFLRDALNEILHKVLTAALFELHLFLQRERKGKKKRERERSRQLYSLTASAFCQPINLTLLLSPFLRVVFGHSAHTSKVLVRFRARRYDFGTYLAHYRFCNNLICTLLTVCRACGPYFNPRRYGKRPNRKIYQIVTASAPR